MSYNGYRWGAVSRIDFFIFDSIFTWVGVWLNEITPGVFTISIIQGGPKKALYFIFHPKVVFYIFFPYFSGGVESRPGRFFWHQYGSKWTLYYAGVDKNHRGVLWSKISSSDTAAMQERFWQEQCTWWKDNSTFDGQISEDRCSQTEIVHRSG